MKILLCEEPAFDARAKPVESGDRRRRTKKRREIRGRRRERDPHRAAASPFGGRVDAGYQEWGDDENAGELFRVGNVVERDQQKADEPGPRGQSHERPTAEGEAQ
jgi:hypothetical protein